MWVASRPSGRARRQRAFSHAVTTVYCGMVVSDPLLAAMMLGNTLGSCAIVALTARKRYAYAKSRNSLIAEQ
jgi:hypothetical protein